MAAPAYKDILELNKNVLISPWKGKLIIQGCLLCDITLWSTYGTVIPVQIPQELDFKYVIKVSSLKERLPEAAFRRQNYLERKVCYQDLCFDLYEVELSNKQGGNVDKLTEYIKNKQLAIIKCLEDRGIFILLTSSALIPEPDFGDEQMGLHGLHLFHSPYSTGVKDLKVEDDISLKVIPILPALNCALLEAKKSLPEERIPPNILVKHNFQEQYKVDKNISLTATPQDGMKETALIGKLSSVFDLAPPLEKCPLECLTQLKYYFSDPSGYALEVSAALDSLVEHPQSPCISDGVCDAGFSLVMTADPEFIDSEIKMKKETQTEKSFGKTLRAKKRAVVPLTSASNLRVQPKRKASVSAAVVPSKRVCHPLSKRTAPRTDNGSRTPVTLKLVKGQFPQKRKRGAEVLTAQFVQKTRLDRKSRATLVSKDAPVVTNAKRASKREKSPDTVVPQPKPLVKKSPQKRKIHVARGSRNPRIRKQPKPAKKEATLHLQREISSDAQKDGINISTAQPENTAVAPKDLPENSIINCDSQALNMLADLALSSAAASSLPSCELRNLPSFLELPQNNVLISKENSLYGIYDHEYHRGVKSKKGVLLPKSSSDGKINSESDLTVSGEENLISYTQRPAETQPALPEEAQDSSDANQNSVAVEHSYALLLAEHSKKHLHQRKLPSPAFAKNGLKGPEAGTPIGKVIPFRHMQNTSPLQKLSEDSLTKRKSRFVSSSLKDFFCSHSVLNCDGSFKITFKCEADYAFNLDSKYTSNSLEKTVVRALHGPWNTDLPENMEEVKLLLHMWVALFYSKKNKVMGSPRKVVEHRNPAKFVCINRSLESIDHSEIEELASVERCSEDPLLEINETSRGHATNRTFPGPKCVLPFIKPPPTRDLELCVQNEQKEMLTGACHLDTSENHNFIYSCSDEVTGGKAKQELSDKLETSNVFSGITNTQTNGSCTPGEDKVFQSPESTRMVSCNGTITQTALTATYDGAGSELVMCQKSVFSTLESKVDTFHPTVQIKAGALQNVIQHGSPINNECQLSLETTDNNREYVMIDSKPVTLAFENNASVLEHTEVNTADKPIGFNTELVKQVSPAFSLQHSLSILKKAQTLGLRDLPYLAGYKDVKCLSASSAKQETHAENLCPLQKEIPPAISSPSLSADKSLQAETFSLATSSNCSLANEETKCPQDAFLQTQNFLSISSGEDTEPSQVKVSSASATLRKKHSLNCIPPRSDTSDDSLELRDGDKGSLNDGKNILQSFNSVFPKQTSLSVNREEVNMNFSGEDNDTDLTRTMSPPPCPRVEVPAGEVEQLQKTPGSKLGLQDRAEEMGAPKEKATLIRNRDMNSASCVRVYPMESKEPFTDEEKGDHLTPLALILPKEKCNLEIAEEINVTSDFPFDSLIGEVSPASSPDPVVRTEETQQSQAMSPCHLKLHSTQYEKNNKFSHIESGDLTLPEKENSFVGPTLPVGPDALTQTQQTQPSAEMPQTLLACHLGRLTLPHKITEHIVPSGHAESLSFSEKVQCYDAELSRPTSPAKYGGNFRPLEKLGKSGNPLQQIYIENRNLDIKHLALESSVPPFSPRKVVETKASADKLSTTAVSGIVNMSLKQKTNSKSRKKTVSDHGLKTNASSYTQTESVNSTSTDRADVKQAYMHSEMSKLDSSLDSSTGTHCTGPVSIEPGFQAQEIPVVRMASLLKSIETELHEESPDHSAVGPQSNSTCTKEKQKTVHGLQDISACEVKKFLNGGVFPNSVHSYQTSVEDISKSIHEEPSTFFVPEFFDSVVCGVSKEYTASESTNKGNMAKKDAETQSRASETSVSSSMNYEPLSGGSDQDSDVDSRNHKLDMKNSCTLRKNNPSKKDDVKDSLGSFIKLNNSDHHSWGYSDKIPELETHSPSRNGTTEQCPILTEDKCMPCYVQIPDPHGIPRIYTNFTVTKEFKATTRTLHTLKRHRDFTANCSLLSSWTSTWHVADDLTQNTLDLEYLRFAHKLKKIVKKVDSQQSASTSSFSKESPAQIAVEAFPSTELSESPDLHLPPKSRSPIQVTVVHSDSRQQSWHRRGHSPSSPRGSSSSWRERCGHNRNTNSERNQTVPFHLNKLKYNSTSKEARNDISLILNEFAEFNKVIMNSNHVLQDKNLNVASEEAISHDMCHPFPRQSASYKDVITDLCATLHVKLKGVLREACKSPFRFYLVETEDKSFFLRTKSILRKRGHTEIEPVHFCQTLHRENDTLIVIIKNEDISSHLHQIPSLLRLKRSPSVVFAGVDSPEDILNDTHQELFRSGGFMISDANILESLTLAQLKEIMKTLEKLNENGRWKWLLHYRENKRLKEDVRIDSVAHKKNLILKSYQSVNIIELLHYHDCDSPSPTKAEILKCLLTLQIQHIDARFAVFLTDKPAVSTEVFENNGILVTDVNYFVKNIQKVAAPFRSRYW